MSVSILFRPLFIKLDNDKYIPVIETGSSNCYTASYKGYYSYARDWSNCRVHKDICCTESELLESIQKERESSKERTNKEYEEYKTNPDTLKNWGIIEYKDENFGWIEGLRLYGKNKTSYKDYLNFFKKGIRQAITLKTAKQLHISVVIRYNQKDTFKIETIYLKDYTDEEFFGIVESLEKEKLTPYVGIHIDNETYSYVKSVSRFKQTTKNVFVAETDKGFIEKFNNFIPSYTKEKSKALRLTLAQYNGISRKLLYVSESTFVSGSKYLNEY